MNLFSCEVRIIFEVCMAVGRSWLEVVRLWHPEEKQNLYSSVHCVCIHCSLGHISFIIDVRLPMRDLSLWTQTSIIDWMFVQHQYDHYYLKETIQANVWFQRPSSALVIGFQRFSLRPSKPVSQRIINKSSHATSNNFQQRYSTKVSVFLIYRHSAPRSNLSLPVFINCDWLRWMFETKDPLLQYDAGRQLWR